MKKINFLSSTKLLMATIGLIIGAFTLLSMSFPDPAYSGPNVNGPKYSHWTTSQSSGGCGGTTTTYHNKTDYGKAIVQADGSGTVSIGKTDKSNTTCSVDGSQLFVTWNTGYGTTDQTGQKNDTELATAHNNEVRLVAVPADGYMFEKWTDSNGNDVSEEKECTVIASIPGASYGSKESTTYQDSDSPYTITYTAHFKEKVSATVTMSAAVGGSYTYSCIEGSGTISTVDGAVTTMNEVTFTAIPDEGYSFWGWYTIENGNVEYFSLSETAVKAFGENTTIYAKFISEKAAWFTVGGTTGKQYWDLNEADAAAKVASKKTIILANDGVLEPGDYTISSGVQLIIPYESTASKGLTSPTVARNSTDAIEPFRTLTITKGTNITVNGTLIVAGSYQSGDNSHNPSGFPVGPVGAIDMSDGGHIQLASNSILYAWGFIQGRSYLDGANVGKDGTVYSGTITAAAGAKVYEDFGLGDWGGGSYTYAVGQSADKSYKIFPFQSYFVQNIEVPLRIENGAQEIIKSCVYAAKGDQQLNNVNFIGNGSDVLFKTGAGGAVTKWYDGTTDHIVFELEGNSSLDNLKFSMSFLIFSVSVQSKEFDTPIMSNMHIKLKDCNLTIKSPLVIQPGGIFEIPQGSSLTIDNTELYVYSTAEWGTFSQKKFFTPTPRVLTPHVNRGSGADNTMEDAQLIVDGTLTVAAGGALYTTASGGDIRGENGGHVVWNRTLPANGHVYGYNNGSSVDGSDTNSRLKPANIVNNETSSGWMHNENGSYTEPLDNETFDNLHGRWFVHSAAENPNADHTYNFTYLNEGVSTTVKAVYSADKTGLVAGYKWMNVTENATYTCGDVKTFTGEDDNLYTYKDGDWMQLVQIGTGATFGGSDDNLYMFVDCDWVSVGEIGDDCLYTIDGVKKALVGSEFVQLAKNSFDEAFHNVANASDYYMLFDGCTWQHADKVAGQEKAYNVRGGFYIWIDEWVLAEPEGSDMYYTTDNQNLKHFYQYDAELGKWGAARMRVRVTSEGGDETEFIYFEDALAQASTVYNPTVTLLTNIELTPTTEIALNTIAKSNKFTLDLNGYTVTMTRTVSGTSTAGVGNRFLNITSNMAVKIMDSSAEQNGQIRCLATGNAYARGITVTDGSLTLESGKLYVQNDAPYASNSYERVYGVVVAVGKTFNMNGGEIETAAEYYSWAVFGSGATTGVSTINMNGGVINANAYYDARGLYSTSVINMTDGIVNATTMPMFSKATGSTTACGVHIAASAAASTADCYRGTLNITGGTINAHAATTTAYGVLVNSSYKINGTTNYNVVTGTASIKNATITATTGTTTAYGVLTYQDKNSTIIENCDITANAGTTTAYGVYVSGYQYSRGAVSNTVKASLANNTISAIAGKDTYGKIAYGVYVVGVQHTSNSSSGSSYITGEFAAGAEVTIDGGSTSAIGTTETAAVYVGPTVTTTNGGASATPKATINGGTYSASGTASVYGIYARGTTLSSGATVDAVGRTGGTVYGVYVNGNKTTINSGSYSGTAYTTISAGVRIAAGDLEINGGEFHAISKQATATKAANSEAYGIYVPAGFTVPISNATVTALGEHTSYSQNIYGIYVLGNSTITNCNVTSKSNTTAAIGIYSRGVVDVYTTDVTAITGTTNAYGVYSAAALTQQGELNFYSGNVKAQAGTSGSMALYVQRAYAYDGASKTYTDYARATANVHGGYFEAHPGTTAAEAVRSYGITHLLGGEYVAISDTITAYGVNVLDGTTTIEDGVRISATAKKAKNTTTAANGFGIYVCGETNSSTGIPCSGTLVMNGGEVTGVVEKGTTAYGIYVSTTKRALTSKGDYNGCYAVAGTATINGGTITGKCNYATAAGLAVAGTTTQTSSGYESASATPRCEIHGGLFKALEKLATTSTEVASINNTPTAENFVITGGHYGLNTNLSKYVATPYRVLDCQEPALMDTYPYEVAEGYKVTFKNGSTVLQEGYVKVGTTPAYTGATPTKSADAQYTYTFDKWSPTITAVSNADQVYTAQFDNTAKSYTLTWDLDGGEVKTDGTAAGSVAYNTSLTAPVVEKTGYTFNGWDPAVPATMPAADASYTAQWTKNSQTLDNIVAGDGNHDTQNETKKIKIETTATDVTIQSDGIIDIQEGATLTVSNDFVLTADAALAEDFNDVSDMPSQAGASGQITFPEGYNASQESAALTTQANVYFDLNIDIKARTWYAVSVPWQVDANTGIAIGTNTLRLGNDEDITYYDGAARAKYGPVTAQTVKYLEDIPVAENRIMQPGTMYFLYFAKKWPNATIRFTKKSGTNTVHTDPVNVTENESQTSNEGDGGWNGISNPKLYSAYVDAGVEYGYVFVGGEYVRITLTETKFAVGTPVMVQAEGTQPVVINRTQSNPATAPMRVRALDPIKMDVFISGADGRATDRLTLKATDEEKADKYVIGQDLAKMSVSTKKAQLWVNRYNSELTVNTQTLTDGTAEYPLVMKAPTAGEYTISIANMENANVYLTYDGQAIWNLSMGEYPISLPQGNTTGYGIRINSRRVTTGMDEALVDSKQETQKIMVDGILYIVRGGQVYDAKGNMVK